ncbi:hypothetical protein WJX74_008481 [Apatococcus lobatus]|uniref:Uncharacterized protein n=1 Tax=Apatococcus lobatus TaxID=904363 RepID=A0AAW1R119_9CHLO
MISHLCYASVLISKPTKRPHRIRSRLSSSEPSCKKSLAWEKATGSYAPGPARRLPDGGALSWHVYRIDAGTLALR